MKTILTAVLILIATSAIASSYEELQFNYYGGYPQWIRNSCRELTRDSVGRTDYMAAYWCAEAKVEKELRDRLIESQIEANEAQAELDRELAKKIRHR